MSLKLSFMMAAIWRITRERASYRQLPEDYVVERTIGI